MDAGIPTSLRKFNIRQVPDHFERTEKHLDANTVPMSVPCPRVRTQFERIVAVRALIGLSCLGLFLSCVPSKVDAQGSIFATPVATPKLVDRYPTAAAFFAATRNGEIPELLIKEENSVPEYQLGLAVTAVLVKEYGVDRSQVDNGVAIGRMLRYMTHYEFKPEDKSSVKEFQSMMSVLREPCRKAFTAFATKYDEVLKQYVTVKHQNDQQKEMELADRQRKAEAVSSKAKEARNQKLAEIFASPAYKQWEAASQVQQGEETISKAQQVLDHNDAVQRESGVTDLAARRAAGEQMVAGKSLVETAFEAYKKQGGKAATPKEVVPGPDPVADFR